MGRTPITRAYVVASALLVTAAPATSCRGAPTCRPFCSCARSAAAKPHATRHSGKHPVEYHRLYGVRRSLPRRYSTGKKTPGAEPGHTRDTHGTHGHTDHTDEPHNHPNPTTHPHDHASTRRPKPRPDSTAARTAAGPEPNRTRAKQATGQLITEIQIGQRMLGTLSAGRD